MASVRKEMDTLDMTKNTERPETTFRGFVSKYCSKAGALENKKSTEAFIDSGATTTSAATASSV